jgi:hypothetical protein
MNADKELLAVALTAQVMFSLLGLCIFFFSGTGNSALPVMFTSMVPLAMITNALFDITLSISRKVLGC